MNERNGNRGRRPSRDGHTKRTRVSPCILYYKAMRGLRTIVEELLMSRCVSYDDTASRIQASLRLIF